MTAIQGQWFLLDPFCLILIIIWSVSKKIFCSPLGRDFVILVKVFLSYLMVTYTCKYKCSPYFCITSWGKYISHVLIKDSDWFVLPHSLIRPVSLTGSAFRDRRFTYVDLVIDYDWSVIADAKAYISCAGRTFHGVYCRKF